MRLYIPVFGGWVKKAVKRAKNARVNQFSWVIFKYARRRG